MEGVHRFLARSYRLVTGDNLTEDEPSKDQLRSLHTAIKRVSAHSSTHPTYPPAASLQGLLLPHRLWASLPDSDCRLCCAPPGLDTRHTSCCLRWCCNTRQAYNGLLQIAYETEQT